MAVMQHQVFEGAIRSVPVKARHLATDHPFVWLSSRILNLTAAMTAFYYEDETSSVVFDRQVGFEDFVGKNWERTRELYQKHFKKDVMPNGPVFENDETVLPLQAADLLAHYTKGHVEGTHSERWIIDRILNIQGDVEDIDIHKATQIAADLNLYQQLKLVLNPGLQLQTYNDFLTKGERKGQRRRNKLPKPP
jgi:hypothetical protein